jgi:starch synthase
VRIGFSEELAHRIEAGADAFVMPSRYEPCGLNQLFSLRYGTVPIVRETGGLADTVTNLSPETLRDAAATGFSFRDYNPLALEQALVRAIETFVRDKPTWSRMVATGMRQDWSWETSARKYVALYEATIARRRAAQAMVSV